MDKWEVGPFRGAASRKKTLLGLFGRKRRRKGPDGTAGKGKGRTMGSDGKDLNL